MNAVIEATFTILPWPLAWRCENAARAQRK